MIDIRIFKLEKGDRFKFKTIKIGRKNKTVPAKREWTFTRVSGLCAYYTDGNKEYETSWKRPVFKI